LFRDRGHPALCLGALACGTEDEETTAAVAARELVLSKQAGDIDPGQAKQTIIGATAAFIVDDANRECDAGVALAERSRTTDFACVVHAGRQIDLGRARRISGAVDQLKPGRLRGRSR